MDRNTRARFRVQLWPCELEHLRDSALPYGVLEARLCCPADSVLVLAVPPDVDVNRLKKAVYDSTDRHPVNAVAEVFVGHTP